MKAVVCPKEEESVSAPEFLRFRFQLVREPFNETTPDRSGRSPFGLPVIPRSLTKRQKSLRWGKAKVFIFTISVRSRYWCLSDRPSAEIDSFFSKIGRSEIDFKRDKSVEWFSSGNWISLERNCLFLLLEKGRRLCEGELDLQGSEDNSKHATRWSVEETWDVLKNSWTNERIWEKKILWRILRKEENKV